jgi:hypothetical protein
MQPGPPFFDAIDSKNNYLTKINYRVRARSERPKDDVGYR